MESPCPLWLVDSVAFCSLLKGCQRFLQCYSLFSGLVWLFELISLFSESLLQFETFSESFRLPPFKKGLAIILNFFFGGILQVSTVGNDSSASSLTCASQQKDCECFLVLKFYDHTVSLTLQMEVKMQLRAADKLPVETSPRYLD